MGGDPYPSVPAERLCRLLTEGYRMNKPTHASDDEYLRYDTIRDAILTCARKPTLVGLIYRTETTTKNCKKKKN